MFTHGIDALMQQGIGSRIGHRGSHPGGLFAICDSLDWTPPSNESTGYLKIPLVNISDSIFGRCRNEFTQDVDQRPLHSRLLNKGEVLIPSIGSISEH
jgi:hypothetical protein